MRDAIWLVLICGCSASSPHPGESTVAFSGTARVFQPWCAGVAPRPEDEAATRRGTPLAQALHVHAGTEFDGGAPIAKLVPGGDGTFRGSLPPGRYCVVTADHEPLSAPIDPAADVACVRQRRAACDAEWLVDATGARNADGSPLAVAVAPSCSWNRPCYPPGPSPP